MIKLSYRRKSLLAITGLILQDNSERARKFLLAIARLILLKNPREARQRGKKMFECFNNLTLRNSAYIEFIKLWIYSIKFFTLFQNPALFRDVFLQSWVCWGPLNDWDVIFSLLAEGWLLPSPDDVFLPRSCYFLIISWRTPYFYFKFITTGYSSKTKEMIWDVVRRHWKDASVGRNGCIRR